MKELKGQVNRTKAIAIRNESNAGRSTEMVFNVNRQQHQEACKTNLSDSSDNQNDRQIERKTFGEVKRQTNLMAIFSESFFVQIYRFSNFLESEFF